METGGATVRWVRPRNRLARKSLIRIVEIGIGALIFLLLLQAVLHFSVADPEFWRLYWPAFVRGVLGTLGYLAIVLPLSVAVGFALGWARLSRHRVVSWPVGLFINFFRGMPLPLIVIFAAILLPVFLRDIFTGKDLALTLGAIALALHSAAFQAEVFRAGFQSVPRGQVEAAAAIGLRPSQAMGHVVLPQALRLSLPPLSNELASLIKDTSLLAAIGALELFGTSRDFMQNILFTPGASLVWILSVWTTVAIVYLFMTFATTELLSILERKYRVRGLEGISV